METVPFSIEYRPKIESGEYKVVTTLGQEVRIIDWDLKQGANKTIVGVVKSTSTGNENVRIYYADGRLKSSGHLELMVQMNKSDLTKFQIAVKDLLKRFSVIVEDDEVIVKEAHKLLKVLNEEGFYNAIDDILGKAAKTFNNGYREGYDDAERKTPKWQSCDCKVKELNRFYLIDETLYDQSYGLKINVNELAVKLPNDKTK